MASGDMGPAAGGDEYDQRLLDLQAELDALRSRIGARERSSPEGSAIEASADQAAAAPAPSSAVLPVGSRPSAPRDRVIPLTPPTHRRAAPEWRSNAADKAPPATTVPPLRRAPTPGLSERLLRPGEPIWRAGALPLVALAAIVLGGALAGVAWWRTGGGREADRSAAARAASPSADLGVRVYPVAAKAVDSTHGADGPILEPVNAAPVPSVKPVQTKPVVVTHHVRHSRRSAQRLARTSTPDESTVDATRHSTAGPEALGADETRASTDTGSDRTTNVSEATPPSIGDFPPKPRPFVASRARRTMARHRRRSHPHISPSPPTGPVPQPYSGDIGGDSHWMDRF